MEQIIEAQLLKNKRPTFLIVLCILTFIGCGWKIAKNIIDCIYTCMIIGIKDTKHISHSVRTYTDALKEVAASDTTSHPDVSLESFNAVVDVFSSYFIYPLAIPMLQSLFLIISVIGAVLMFKLKRKGLYIYAVAQILYFVVTLYFMGFSFWSLFFISPDILISLLFIILFAVNLKHIRT